MTHPGKCSAQAATCPLIAHRTQAGCPAKCRGCSSKAGVGSGRRHPGGESEGPLADGGAMAAVCPRVPQRMKYTCSGKCPGCRGKEGSDGTLGMSLDAGG